LNNFFQKYFKRPKKEKKITVIHCDYHEMFRRGLRSVLLKYADIEFIGESSDGPELLKLLESTIPDIVVLNVRRPILDCVETLAKIRENYPDLKVIVFSMHNSKEVITKMMQFGANSYLAKNADSETIYRTIKCVHEFDYYYSECIERAWLGPNLEFDRIGRKYSDEELKIIGFMKEKKSIGQIADRLNLSQSAVSAMAERISRNRLK
jgi:DNA-binding NarL/FixJ family response regulator